MESKSSQGPEKKFRSWHISVMAQKILKSQNMKPGIYCLNCIGNDSYKIFLVKL
jgi:hypothetical protein